MDASRKLNKLVADTEELLERLADEHGPKIEAVRKRLLDSLERTKRAISEQRRGGKDGELDDEDVEDELEVSVGLRGLAGWLIDYVRSDPWLALATGVLIAASAGILATSATKRSYRRNA